MLRIFIRKGQMKRCAWQLRTLRSFSALLLSFQILFSLQQSQWYRSQNVHSFAQNSSTRSHLTESKPRVPAMAYQALCRCVPSRPHPYLHQSLLFFPHLHLFILLPWLIWLQPDVCCLSEMFPGYSHGLFLHLCSVFAHMTSFNGSFPCYLPYPF